VPVSEAIQRWWPLPDSLDLVRAPIDVAAAAVQAEITRFVNGERLSSTWVPFASLAHVFGSVSVFTNVPTVYFILPTRSEWTVLWDNCFLCDGYDSLCWCLTTNHALTTMHWRASDEDAVFQAGSTFTFRQPSDSGLKERSAYCGKNDKRWEFHAAGEPLSEEDVAGYSARPVRDRLNERRMLDLLARLGARPWDDDFYQAGKAFRIERLAYPDTISKKSFPEFACRRRASND
jgi:hypothetical protein